jgi:hypothetical protein
MEKIFRKEISMERIREILQYHGYLQSFRSRNNK